MHSRTRTQRHKKRNTHKRVQEELRGRGAPCTHTRTHTHAHANKDTHRHTHKRVQEELRGIGYGGIQERFASVRCCTGSGMLQHQTQQPQVERRRVVRVQVSHPCHMPHAVTSRGGWSCVQHPVRCLTISITCITCRVPHCAEAQVSRGEVCESEVKVCETEV